LLRKAPDATYAFPRTHYARRLMHARHQNNLRGARVCYHLYVLYVASGGRRSKHVTCT